MMDPIVIMFQKKTRMKRNAALLLTFMLMFAIITVILVFLIPAIISNLKEIVVNIPIVQQRLDDLAERFSHILGSGRGNTAYGFMEKYLNQIADELEKRSMLALEGIAKSYKKILSALFDVITAIILLFIS